MSFFVPYFHCLSCSNILIIFADVQSTHTLPIKSHIIQIDLMSWPHFNEFVLRLIRRSFPFCCPMVIWWRRENARMRTVQRWDGNLPSGMVSIAPMRTNLSFAKGQTILPNQVHHEYIPINTSFISFFYRSLPQTILSIRSCRRRPRLPYLHLHHHVRSHRLPPLLLRTQQRIQTALRRRKSQTRHEMGRGHIRTRLRFGLV